MSYTQIKATVKDQALQLTNVPRLASGSIGVLQIACTFDELWDGYGKTGVFFRDEKKVFHAPVVDNVVTVPHEVLTTEGSFLFGLMGVADNTRTTEVLRINLAQGAITRPTADAQNPTPNIYSQLLQAYGVTEQRVDEIIAMRGQGYLESALSDEYISGTIRSNGANAFISFTISKMSLIGGGWHYTDYCIAPALAPLCPVELKTSNPDINITIEEPNAEGWARMLIENVGNADLDTDMVENVSGIYPLRSVYVAEVGDIRVAHDGTVYDTAGTAVREQVKAAAQTGGATAEQLAQINANAEAIADIQDPVVSGTTAVSVNTYTLTMPRESGAVDTLVVEFDGNGYVSKVTENGRVIPWTTTGV